MVKECNLNNNTNIKTVHHNNIKEVVLIIIQE